MSKENYDPIIEAVSAGNGVATFTMRELREAHGAERLGVHVITSITQKLDGLGIGHSPKDLPGDQGDRVRLYRKGTPIARLILAVHNVNDAHGDDLLRSLVASKSDELLQKVREIVCG